MRLAAVEAEGLDAAVRGEQDGAAGGLIHAARLHPHKPALHNVHPADACGGGSNGGWDLILQILIPQSLIL